MSQSRWPGEELSCVLVNRFYMQIGQTGARIHCLEVVPGGSGTERPRASLQMSRAEQRKQKGAPLETHIFRRRLYQLCDDAHGDILIKDRNSWYRFNENVVRGYVRLQAQRAGVELGRDHF